MRMTKRLCCGSLIALALCLLPLQAFAWDNTVSGTVGTLQVYRDGSFAVSLSGYSTICSQVSGWYASYVIVNTGNPVVPATPDGVKVLYSSLLAAKLAKKQVSLYTMYSGGVCYLGAIDVND